MNETDTTDRQSVYEISYLIIPSVSEEKIPSEAEALRKIVLDAGAAVIDEEMPHLERLAYTMRTKTVSGAYDAYSEAYFGWIKFEVGSDKIEAIKKSFGNQPSVLRMLLITTVREATYLGKRARAIAALFGTKTELAENKVEVRPEVKKDAPPVSMEELDKSIDEMVKEAI